MHTTDIGLNALIAQSRFTTHTDDIIYGDNLDNSVALQIEDTTRTVEMAKGDICLMIQNEVSPFSLFKVLNKLSQLF